MRSRLKNISRIGTQNEVGTAPSFVQDRVKNCSGIKATVNEIFLRADSLNHREI